MSKIFAVVTALILVACAHTNTETTLFDREGKVILKDAMMDDHPDAEVYTTHRSLADPEYDDYMAERGFGDHTTSWVGRALPSEDVSFRSDASEKDGMVNVTSTFKTCVPETDFCRRSVERQVYVIRDVPLDRDWKVFGEGNSVDTASGGYAMLRITTRSINTLILKLQSAWRGERTPGVCKELRGRGRVDGRSEPLMRAIHEALARPDGYVTYHAIRELNDALTRYQSAMNGCIRDPAEKHLHLERGRQILAQFSKHLGVRLTNPDL